MAITWGTIVYGPDGRSAFRLGYEIGSNNTTQVSVNIYAETRWSIQDTRFQLDISVDSTSIHSAKQSINTYRDTTNWGLAGASSNIVLLKSFSNSTAGTHTFSASLKCTATNSDALLYGRTCSCSSSFTVTSPPTTPSLPTVTQTPAVLKVAFEQHSTVGFTIHVQTDYFDINNASLLIPTWTAKYGQGTYGELVKWYLADKVTHTYNGVTYHHKYTVPFSDHNSSMNTTYYTHFYWTRTGAAEGGCANNGGTSFTPDTTAPQILAVHPVQINTDTYYVYIQTDSTTKSVQIPTWTSSGGQDDLLWTSAVKETNTIENVTYNWRGTVSRHDHRPSGSSDLAYGIYITDPYVYNGYDSASTRTSINLVDRNLAPPKNCFVKLNKDTRAIDYGFTWPTLTDYSPVMDRVDIYLNYSDSPILPAADDASWTLLSSVKESDLDTNKRYSNSFNQGVQIERLAGKYIFIKLRAYPTSLYSDAFSSAIVFTYEYIPNGQEKDIIKIKNQNDFISGLVKYKLADGSWQPCITEFK